MDKRRYRRDDKGRRRLVRVCERTGVEGYEAVETIKCSGCTEVGEMGGQTWGPFGCDECGYTGKRRVRFWIPFDINEYVNADAVRAAGRRG